MAMHAPVADAPLRPSPGAPPAFRPVVVAVERCKGCGLCVDVCAPHSLELDPVRVNALGHHPVVLVDPDTCTSCAKCARMCPDAALAIFARPRGADR
jgi:2-oxoglutarate ferredoxin oxidoreductase subunit delta